MSNPLSNRYEFLVLFDCENGNPNGDPDNGQRSSDRSGRPSWPSVRCGFEETLRNYVEISRNAKHETAECHFCRTCIQPQSADYGRLMKRKCWRPHDGEGQGGKGKVEEARKWMCKNFYDVRVK